MAPEGLEAFELVEGFVEAALGAGLVAGEGVQGVGASGVVAVDHGRPDVRREMFVVFLHALLQVEEAEIEDAGLDDVDAAEAPGGGGDFLDEVFLDGALRLVVVAEVSLEVFVLVLVLAFDDGDLGGEAMAEGVPGDAGLALGGFGAGAFLSVAAVGVDLFLTGHKWPPCGEK
jgi:hypothetical protein